jgi:hypothetical protein
MDVLSNLKYAKGSIKSKRESVGVKEPEEVELQLKV